MIKYFSGLMLILVACNQKSDPPHTTAQYDSISVGIMQEKHRLIDSLVAINKIDEATQIGKLYNTKLDSIGKERFKYYGR